MESLIKVLNTLKQNPATTTTVLRATPEQVDVMEHYIRNAYERKLYIENETQKEVLILSYKRLSVDQLEVTMNSEAYILLKLEEELKINE